jgi:hypothetical protein
MREAVLFCEDSFHEKFVGALIARFARDHDVGIQTRILSATGGLPRMHGEFRDFLRDLDKDQQSPPDAIIVVVDANCSGYTDRRNLMRDAVAKYGRFEQLVAYAIPDPHIERWMLCDPGAFRTVFGRGCTVPAITCEKDRYKRLLRQEIRQSGIDAPLGGVEFAEDIVGAMDLARVETQEPSLGRFLRDLKAMFNGWRAR